MKRILPFCLFVFGVNLAADAQKKFSEKELIAYDWICYSHSLNDPDDLLSEDTLLLIKSVDKETLEGVPDEEGNQPAEAFTRSWNFYFEPYNDSCDNCLSFSINFIDLKSAALSRYIHVDSALFMSLQTNPELLSEQTVSIRPILDALSEHESLGIQLEGQQENRYFIKRSKGKLVVLQSTKGIYAYEPNGLHEGSWKIRRRKQLLAFISQNNSLEVQFKMERIDDMRMRLVRSNVILR